MTLGWIPETALGRTSCIGLAWPSMPAAVKAVLAVSRPASKDGGRMAAFALVPALALPVALLSEARGSVKSSDSSATDVSPTLLLDFLDSDSRGSSWQR